MRTKDQQKRDATLAWLVGVRNAQTKTKKGLPSLSTILQAIDGDVSRRQTTREMRSALRMLSQQYGIPLRKGGVTL